jgi:hypothetical protein
MFRSRARLQFLALLCTVAGAAAVGASDILTQFRLGQPAAETYVFDAVWNQGLGYFGAGTRIFKALPPEARAAAVTAAAAPAGPVPATTTSIVLIADLKGSGRLVSTS